MRMFSSWNLMQFKIIARKLTTLSEWYDSIYQMDKYFIALHLIWSYAGILDRKRR